MPEILDLNLNFLPILVALYDERSVTHAAEKLKISQPTVSVALGKLRLAFADQLFIKTSRGLEATSRAEALVPLAREFLARVKDEMLSNATFDPEKATTVFTFALTETAELFFLAPIVEGLRKAAPHARVRSVFPTPRDSAIAMTKGEIDIAIGNFSELETSNFFRQKLFSGDFACLVRKKHPVSVPRLTLKQYLEMEHVVVRSGRSTMAERTVGRFMQRRKIGLACSHTLSLQTVLEQTDLVATVSRPLALFLISRGAKLRILRPPSEFPKIDVQQYWHRKFQNNSRHQWLRGFVKQLFPAKVSQWLRT